MIIFNQIGGEEILLKYAGKDVTKAMTETNPHSEAALENLQTFEIGVLKGQEVEVTVQNSKRKILREEAKVDLREPILIQVSSLYFLIFSY